MKFQDEQTATAFVLRESASILRKHNVKFVIVGGWVSYLFNHHLYGHPGTYDVDVLLDSSSLDDGTFTAASEELLDVGYLRAAKNQFQVHRVLDVRNEQMLFHVDFLNEKNQENTLELQTGEGRVRSIYTPAMQVVFTHGNYRRLNETEFAGIDFPSEESFIATKAVVVRVAKRQRDAFDIFVTLMGSNNFDYLCKNWQELVAIDGFILTQTTTFGPRFIREMQLRRFKRF